MFAKSDRLRAWGGAAALVLASGLVVAQANTVTYQGVIRDSAGGPVADGAYPMSFGVFAAETGGAALWTEPQTVTTLDGAFSVQLGAVTPLGTLFADNAEASLWLEVSADVGAGMQAYAPRVPLTRAPYAFHATQAGDADTLDGKHAADIASDISAAVSTHDASGTAHSDIRTQIGADIAAHDVSGAAHSDIRAQIGADIAAHDADTGAHPGLEIDAARITSGKIDNERLSMGSGGGIDADTLDGSHLSSIQAYVDTTHGASPTAHQDIRDKIDADLAAHDTDASAHGAAFTAHDTDASAHANIALDGARITSGKIDNARLNTGSGGGLDADTVDGQHASAFAGAAHSHALNDLSDVNAASPGVGHALTWDGGDWRAIGGYAIIREVKPAGTPAGNSSAGWNHRDLNHLNTNIAGASLSNKDFTLPAGRYKVTASAPAFMMYGHKVALYNVTSSSYAIIGTVEWSNPGVDQTQTRSFLEGRLNLSAPATFRILHYIQGAYGTYGLGVSTTSAWGVEEVYTMVVIDKY
ncbi:MAG TPA: hypothetical protein PKI11_16035 [Candidatus Hydrogenedentes bacterium]|nr:hypothetical protein [Candidatus Hydrogenedentota bacterium]HNT87156.1 hypothetical protein [Candidatus Hydrogenedentota bacterium]